MRLSADSLRRRISEQLRPRRAGQGDNRRTASPRESGIADTTPGQSVDVSDLYGIDDHESFIREAYQRILGREVDVYGFVRFREMLRNRLPKEAVVQSLVGSEEARKANRSFVGLRSFGAAMGGARFRLVGRLRSLGARLLLRTRNLLEILMQGWRFELLEVKMDMLQERLIAESERSVRPALETLWQLSEKTDKYAREVGDRQQLVFAALEGRIGANFAAVQSTLECLAGQLRGIEAALRELRKELACTRGELEVKISRLRQASDARLRQVEVRLTASQEATVRQAEESVIGRLSSYVVEARQDHEDLRKVADRQEEELKTSLAAVTRSVEERMGQMEGRLVASQESAVRQAEELKTSLAAVTRSVGERMGQMEGRLVASQESVVRQAEESVIGQLSGYVLEARQDREDLRKAADRQEELKTSLAAVSRSVEDRLDKAEARLRPAVVHSGADVVITEIDGLIIGVPGEEWRMAAYHVFRGALEPGLVRAFKETVQPGMVVVDVGANVGMYTLLATRIVGTSGKVLSFEPAPRVRTVLRGNVQVNGFLESNIVELRSEALSDRRGTADFTVYPGDSGHSTLFGGPADGERIQVATETLDNALALLARVDVVKIDAEGAEPFILDGMRGTLRRCPQMELFMEFSPSLLRRAGVDPADFLQKLRQMNLEILLVDALTGERRGASEDQLLNCYSENLNLHRQRRGNGA
jgi:FkbM family methyltransferase